jgi:hypothetical protein
VHAPSGIDGTDPILVDDLPAGSIFIFSANLFTSFFFQFVGFLLTYLLHTSHAAKYGSRAGLGLTLIQYGFYSRVDHGGGEGDGEEQGVGWLVDDPKPSAPLLSTSPPTSSPTPTAGSQSPFGVSSSEWVSFLLMTLGNFV